MVSIDTLSSAGSSELSSAATDTPSAPLVEPYSNDPIPFGDVRRVGPVAEKSNIRDNHYSWRSNGHQVYAGMAGVNVDGCMGVFKCPACGKLTRVPTNFSKGKTTSNLPCDSRQCRPKQKDDSQIFPQLIKCSDGKAYSWLALNSTGSLMYHWHHQGTHESHGLPPPKGLTMKEKEKLLRIVQTNPKGSAHTLRTGEGIPDADPLYEISPVLANSSSARYHVGLARKTARVSKSEGLGSGGFSVMKALGELKDRDGKCFILETSLQPVTYIIFQTPWMKQVLCDAVDEWLADAVDAAGRHGVVSDTNETFFREGGLQISAVFDTNLLQWVPIQLTWMLGKTEQHFRPHFRRLNQAILEHSGDRFKYTLVMQVFLTYFIDYQQFLTCRRGHGFLNGAAKCSCSRKSCYNRTISP